MHILVVEDEPKLSRLLSDYLLQAGWQTSILADGNDVVPWVREQQPDLVLLDVMLPNKDGIAICREVRQFSTVPIIMVTARIEEIDRILGLEIGADDYICKPFSPREVVARIRAVMRRLPSSLGDVLPANRLQLERDTLSVSLKGVRMELTLVEFEILSALVARPGRILSREKLMESIYPDYRVVSDRTIDSHIKKLRRKLELLSPGEELIHSVYGVGYKYQPSESVP